MTNKIEMREFFKSLGLVLVFVGMQLNTAIRNVFPSVDIVEVIMVASIFGIADVSNAGNIHMTKKQLGLIVFQLLLLVMNLFSQNGTKQLLTFHIYLIALIIAFCTQKNYVQYKYFGRVLFYLSGFIAVVVCFQATEGFSRLIVSYHATSKLWLEHGGDPVSVSRALGINIVAVLFYKKQNIFEKVMAYFFTFFSIIGLLSFANRASIIYVVIVFAVWSLKYYNDKINRNKILMEFFTIAIVLILFNKVSYLQEKTTALFHGILNGVSTLLGWNVGSVDSSAISRVVILEKVEEEFWLNPIKNLLMGLGYNWIYVDRPIYQAFFDLGIGGVIAYLYYLLFIPMKFLVLQIKADADKRYYNDAFIFIVFITIQVLMDQFYCGLPYYYYLWTPTIFLVSCTYFCKEYSYERNVEKI